VVRHGHFGFYVGCELDREVSWTRNDRLVDTRRSTIGLGEQALVQFVIWTPCLREQREVTKRRRLSKIVVSQNSTTNRNQTQQSNNKTPISPAHHQPTSQNSHPNPSQTKRENITHPSSPRIMQMAKPSDIAPIRSIPPLQLITISISHSFRHRKRQTSSSKNMATIDRSNERVDEAQDVGSVLRVGILDSRNQDSETRERRT
jgi:hypothetical protein